MDVVAALAAGLAGLLVGSLINRLVVLEPAYVITDPKDLPDGADPSLLLELEPAPSGLPGVPVLALVRPGRSWRRWFPVTEAVTALVFAAIVVRFGPGIHSAVLAPIAAALVCLAAVDLRVYRIPDRINFPATGVGFALIAAGSLLGSEPVAVLGAASGGAWFATLLFVAHVISPRGMGWGDVKLGWLMGFALGWGGPAVDWTHADGWVPVVLDPLRSVLAGMVIGSVLGVVVGGGYALARRSARAVFPYGPALVAGCILALLAGDRLVS